MSDPTIGTPAPEAIGTTSGSPSDSSARTHVFICYRRNDGDWSAEWLHRSLDEVVYTNYEGAASRLHVYYDKTAPGVADWKKLHFPSLQTAHALLLVCTPGIAKDLSRRGHPDWVYEELRWWCKHRRVPPIVIDTTGEGDRWLPEEITKKWPNLNRIDLTRADASAATPDSLVASRVRDRIVETIRESDRSTVFENLEKFKKVNRRLAWALAGAFALLLAAGAAGFLAARYNSMAEDALRVAQSRQLAAQSEVTRSQPGGFLVSTVLAVEALRRAPTPEADKAIRNALALLPSRILPLAHKVDSAEMHHAVSRDGTRVVTWPGPRLGDERASPSELAIWEVPSGRHIATLQSTTPATAVAISPDGSRVAVSHKQSGVDVWDAAAGKLLFEIPQARNATVLAFDREGRRLAAGGYFPWVTVVGLDSGETIARVDADAPVLALEFSPAGQALALGLAPTPEQANNNTYFIYQGVHAPSRLGLIRTAKVFDLGLRRWAFQLEHEGAVFSLRYSNDGRHLATACWDGGVRVWDAATGAIFKSFAFPKTVPVSDIVFTPDNDSTFLAMAAANDQVIVWDWRKNVEVAKLNVAGVRKLAFSSDSLRLATSSPTTTRVWAYIEATESARMQHGSNRFDEPASFSADGKWLVSGGEYGRAWIWSAASSDTRVAVRHKGKVDAVALIDAATHASDPGRRNQLLLSGGFDGYTRLWDSTTGAERFKVLSPARIHGVAFDAGGKRFASGGGLKNTYGFVRVWTTGGFRVVWQKELATRIWSVALSPDGTLLAAGDGDGIAHLWDLASGQERCRVAHGENREVQAVAFSTDGALAASGSLDGTVRLWSTLECKESRRFEGRSGIMAVALSPDGRLLASGSLDGDLLVRDIRSESPLLDLKPGGAIADVAFSPDGRSIASTSDSGSAKVWDLASGRLQISLQAGKVNGIAFSRDGRHLATAGSNGQVKVFALRREDLLQQVCERLTRTLTTEESKEWLADLPHGSSCPLQPWGTSVPQDLDRKATAGRGLVDQVAAFVLLVKEFESEGRPGASLVDEAVGFAREGGIAQALEAFARIEANKDLEITVDPDAWNALCWHGALVGRAKDVLHACDNAVQQAAKRGGAKPPEFYLDSRGVARALLGNNEGAVSDLAAHLSWCRKTDCGDEYILRRESWVKELRAGRNPFDKAVLERLRNE